MIKNTFILILTFFVYSQSHARSELYKTGSKDFGNEVYLYFNYCTDTSGVVFKFWSLDKLCFSASTFYFDKGMHQIIIKPNEEPYYNIKIHTIPIVNTTGDSITKYFAAFNFTERYFFKDFAELFFYFEFEEAKFEKNIHWKIEEVHDSVQWAKRDSLYLFSLLTDSMIRISKIMDKYYNQQFHRLDQGYFNLYARKLESFEDIMNSLQEFRFSARADISELFVFSYLKMGPVTSYDGWQGGYQPYKIKENDMEFSIRSNQKLLGLNGNGYKKIHKMPKRIKQFFKENRLKDDMLCRFYQDDYSVFYKSYMIKD